MESAGAGRCAVHTPTPPQPGSGSAASNLSARCLANGVCEWVHLCAAQHTREARTGAKSMWVGVSLPAKLAMKRPLVTKRPNLLAKVVTDYHSCSCGYLRYFAVHVKRIAAFQARSFPTSSFVETAQTRRRNKIGFPKGE